MERQSLYDVQPGDKIIMYTSYENQWVKKVVRVTKSHILVESDFSNYCLRFRKKDGNEHREFGNNKIQVWTERGQIEIDLIAKRKTLNKIQFNFSELAVGGPELINKVYDFFQTIGIVK